MSTLSIPMQMLVAYCPLLLVVTGALFSGWWRTRGAHAPTDSAGKLLTLAILLMSGRNRDWGRAMLGELKHVEGRSARWQFALGCVHAILLESRCGLVAIALPVLGL